jgi:hypothetical protein
MVSKNMDDQPFWLTGPRSFALDCNNAWHAYLLRMPPFSDLPRSAAWRLMRISYQSPEVLTGSSPSPRPLPRGERANVQPLQHRSFSPPHPLADAVMLSCELAKASSPGEGQDEGALGRDIWRLVLVIRPGERAGSGIVARHMLGRRLGSRLQGHTFPAACSDGHHPPAIGGRRFQVTVREARA